MLVKDIMCCNLKTVRPDTPMSSVVADMCLYRISGLPVVGENKELLGFIAEKDVLHHLFPTLEDAMNLRLQVVHRTIHHPSEYALRRLREESALSLLRRRPSLLFELRPTLLQLPAHPFLLRDYQRKPDHP